MRLPREARKRMADLLPALMMVWIVGVTAVGADAGTLLALEMSSWPPEKIARELRAVTPAYGGETPEELLDLLDVMVRQEESKPERGGLGADSLDLGYGPSIDLTLDLLHEWPSTRLTRLVKERLRAPSGERLHAGLLAAGSVAADPAVAALVVEAIDQAAKKGVDASVVLGLLALGQSRNADLIPRLEPFLADPIPARREAAARALHTLRTALGLQRVPPLDPKAAVPTACVIGPDLLADYRSLPRGATTNASSLGFLAVTVGGRTPAPFSDGTLRAMASVLTAGGTVLIAKPGGGDWHASLKSWADKNGVELPGQTRDAYGIATIRYADYRAFADYPFELRDQPGRAADLCWSEWSAPLAAPVLAGNRAGALVVVQEGVLGEGRVVFTTVNLATRPIYRENLLRWVYGDALLAHAFQFTKDYDFRPTGQTEHVPWLKPISGEKPKVLYLTASLFKRGLLELLQRLDMDWRYVPYDASFALPARKNETGPPSRMAQRAVCLLEEAVPWADTLVFDVGSQNLLKSLTQSVLGTMSLDSVPARLRRAIYRRVHADGMGLLGIGDPRAFESCLEEFAARVSGTPAETNACRALTSTLDPFLAGGEFGGELRNARRGKGRLFWFDRPLPHLETGFGRTEATPEDFAVPGLFESQHPLSPREYAYALLAKCVLWTLGRDAAPSIAKVDVLVGAAGRPATVHVVLSRPFTGRCEAAFRDAYNVLTAPASAPVDGAEVSFPASALPEGVHVAEVRLMDGDGRMVDVAATRIDVAGSVRIEEIKPDKAFYATNDTARLAVKLSALFAGTVRVEAVDTYGRRVFAADRVMGTPAREYAAEIPIWQPLSRLWDVHVRLLDGDRVLSHRRQPIGIGLPPRERDVDVTATLVDRTLASFFRDRMGVDVTYGDPELALRHNLELSAGSWSGSLGASCTPGSRLDPREREPCLSSPAFRMRAIRDMREKGGQLRDLGIRDYMIADECGLGGRCFAPDSLFRFRVKLREGYGDIGTLNREWGTAFARWDDVLPCQGGSLEKPGAYVDFDIFTSWVFAEYCNYLEMLAGDRMGNFYAGQSGGIHDNLMMHLSGALFYYGVIEQAVSMKRADAVIGSWYRPGYRFVENHETACRRWPWWHVFRGTTRMQLWYPSSGPPAFHEDLSRPYHAFTWLKEEMDDVRLGIGKLLLHARRDEGRAAVYLSERSRFVLAALKEIRAATSNAVPTQAVPRDISTTACNRFQQAILGEQIECRFVSEYQAEAGAISGRGLKLVVMPGAVSLSAKERAALKAFVEEGGVLVADIGAGTRNEHGTLVGPGLVEELLGAGTEAVPGPTPALSARPCGKGRVAVLDFAELVDAASKSGLLEAGKTLVRDMLRMADLKPVVSVTDSERHPVPMDFGSFSDGEALYAGFVVPGKGGMVAEEKPVPVTIAFPSVAHVYDARRGGYVGEVSSWKTDVVPSIAQVYAALPYRLDGLEVVPSGASYHPGDVVECVIRARVSGPTPGLQVWLLQVRGPGGAPRQAYTRRLLARGGEAKVLIPIALNAPPGAWDVSVRDAATGVTGQGTFRVKEVQP